MLSALSNWLVGLSLGRKRFVQLLADTGLIALSLILAFALRLDSVFFLRQPWVWEILLVLIPTSLGVFIRLGFYRAVVRYITSRAFTTIIIGVFASSVTLALAAWITGAPMPRSVPVIYGLLALFSIGGLRYLMRRVLISGQSRLKTRIIIYGAGASGRQLQLSLASGPEYLPVAFVDDNKDLQGRNIGDCTVHSPADLLQVIENYDAKSLLLAMPSLSRVERAAILRRIDDLPIHVQTIPGMADLVSGRTQIVEITDVPIEDLLGRDPVPPHTDLMQRDLRNRVVMVTGAGGSIGSELCRQIIEQAPKRLVLLDTSEYNLYSIDQELQALSNRLTIKVEIVSLIGSVQNRDRVSSALKHYSVETIYHAAAYKHVPLVEDNVVEGIQNNVFGTLVLAEAAIEAKVTAFILVSTDKAVRPTNVMGASKRMAELICQAMAAHQNVTRFSMVRFGNVLGSSGSVIPLFRRQIAAGGPITVTHPDITRYFMTIPEAAQLVIQAGAMARGGDVFVLDMGEPIRITDLAIRMAKLSGLRPVVSDGAHKPGTLGGDDIEIKFTGLRPGEKLYEELLIGDGALPTEHPRIMTATEITLDRKTLNRHLDQLRQHCHHHDTKAIRSVLIAANTGYVSSSSTIEQ
ncbi:MAG: polysaccharide biosynthesis protein [Paracoccaceae bacterium]